MEKLLALWIGFLLIANGIHCQPNTGILEPGVLPEFKKVGQGDPVLLLIPCMSCRWNEWESFMEQNKERYTMYAVTLPGFGGAPYPDLPKNIDGVTPWRGNALKALSGFIDDHDLKDIVLMGHSWGTMVGLQLAARRSDVISRFIAVDGTLESDSWVSNAPDENRRSAARVDSICRVFLNDAEEWRKFNAVTYRYRKDSIAEEDVQWALKLHGSFMATPKEVLQQYWRENLFIDLTKELHQLSIPVLDIQSFVGSDMEQQKVEYQKTMEKAKAPKNVHSVFLYKTGHFIMQHRPEIFSEIVYQFIHGRKLQGEYDF